ncbi:MAG: hypothetical protein R3F04_13010 [Lysobacteraceae bacterium]
MDLSVKDAQFDMRQGYYSSATGILASALVWFGAAGVAVLSSPQKAMWTLLIGGMFIYPLGLLLCKLLGARGAHAKGNPLGLLAGASTFWLIFCLPIAYLLGASQPTLFFPAMLLIIGGRYLVFATLYGMRLYWALGLTLAAAGFSLAALRASVLAGATAGAIIEVVFAVICFVQHQRWVPRETAWKPLPLPGAA